VLDTKAIESLCYRDLGTSVEEGVCELFTLCIRAPLSDDPGTVPRRPQAELKNDVEV
jgi:hypothetical protein